MFARLPNCSFLSEVALSYPDQVYTIAEHNSADAAAHTHDRAAIGIFGARALGYLNLPAYSYSVHEVLHTMELLASKVGGC